MSLPDVFKDVERPTRVRAMNPGSRDFALDPQDLARLLVSRANAVGEQRPAMLRENLALTSTRLPNGIVTAEVGTWLWAIDQPSIGV